MTSDAGEVGERRWGDFYSDGVGHWARDGSRPLLTDAEVLKELFTDPCETCQGDPHKIDRWTCPDCNGTGRVLRDGVDTFLDSDDVWRFLRWLEDDDD